MKSGNNPFQRFNSIYEAKHREGATILFYSFIIWLCLVKLIATNFKKSSFAICFTIHRNIMDRCIDVVFCVLSLTNGYYVLLLTVLVKGFLHRMVLWQIVTEFSRYVLFVDIHLLCL